MIIIPEKELDNNQQFEEDIWKIIRNDKYGDMQVREIIGSFEYIKSKLIEYTPRREK